METPHQRSALMPQIMEPKMFQTIFVDYLFETASNIIRSDQLSHFVAAYIAVKLSVPAVAHEPFILLLLRLFRKQQLFDMRHERESATARNILKLVVADEHFFAVLTVVHYLMPDTDSLVLKVYRVSFQTDELDAAHAVVRRDMHTKLQSVAFEHLEKLDSDKYDTLRFISPLRVDTDRLIIKKHWLNRRTL